MNLPVSACLLSSTSTSRNFLDENVRCSWYFGECAMGRPNTGSGNPFVAMKRKEMKTKVCPLDVSLSSYVLFRNDMIEAIQHSETI
mmetsp:Transcript_15166/g.42163  ORF Transcript_15166/g.42163 Transcript_15166/m.42163 type:complete len:86 (-) Transcript_15166:843-1100(-)